MMKNILVPCICLMLICIQQTDAQYASKKVKDVHRAYTDSLKQVKYDNVFPIWGQKVYKKGFDIPYPTGIMVNYMYIHQGLIIDDLKLGLKTDDHDIPLTEIDFVEFGDNLSEASTVMFRPDIWVFPFLNVYGVFGFGNTHTEVNLEFPVELKSVVDQQVRTSGFGFTAAGGVGPVWLAIDGNLTYTKPELLEEAVKVTTFGVRLGTKFVFNNKPYRNISFWIGAMKASLGSNTVGELKLKDALPPEVFERADEIVEDYYNWYNSLDPTSPIDAAKIKKADEVLTPIIERIDAADGDAIIRYGMNKSVKQEWNGILGFQYQYNKGWILRAEGGIIGDRKSILVSLNYRFLL